MSFIDIAGLPFLATAMNIGEVGRTFAQGGNGDPISSDGLAAINRDEREFTHRLTDADTARFWFRLLRGEGQVWNFEHNDDLSANRLPSIDTLPISASNPQFGVYHTTRSGTDLDVAAIPDGGNFTVAYWYDDGGGYDHVVCTRLPVDVADRIWVDGVRNDAYAIPHIIAGNVFTLDTTGDFDDIVVLPFGTPDDIAGAWPLTEAFSPLPKIKVGGGHWTQRLAEVVSTPNLTARKSGLAALYTLSVTLRARPDLVITSEELVGAFGLTALQYARAYYHWRAKTDMVHNDDATSADPPTRNAVANGEKIWQLMDGSPSIFGMYAINQTNTPTWTTSPADATNLNHSVVLSGASQEGFVFDGPTVDYRESWGFLFDDSSDYTVLFEGSFANDVTLNSGNEAICGNYQLSNQGFAWFVNNPSHDVRIVIWDGVAGANITVDYTTWAGFAVDTTYRMAFVYDSAANTGSLYIAAYGVAMGAAVATASLTNPGSGPSSYDFAVGGTGTPSGQFQALEGDMIGFHVGKFAYSTTEMDALFDHFEAGQA